MSNKAKLGLAFVFLILWMIFMTSCSSSKKLEKAKKIMLANPDTLAKLAAERFPPVKTVYVNIDSAGYEETVLSLMTYSDSLLEVVRNRNTAIDSLHNSINNLQGADTGVISDLRSKLAAIKPVDVKKLRESIKREVKSKVKPCKDSTIIEEDGPTIAALRADKNGLILQNKNLQIKVDELKVYRNWLIFLAIGVFIGLVAWGWVRVKAGALTSAFKIFRGNSS